MKIALVHDWLTGFRGGEKCLECLCRHFPDAELFTLVHRPGKTSPDIERMRITTSLLQHIPGIGKYYRWSLPLMPAAIERVQLPSDIQAVVSLSHSVAKSVKPPPGVPHICYCFTPMRYAWHLREEYFPGATPSDLGMAGRILHQTKTVMLAQILDRIREWDRAASHRVTHYVAISETIRGRIRDCYDRESQVVYPPVDTDFYTPDDLTREDFYLCVSALVPYKRIELAIAACNQLQRRLVVIGHGPSLRRLAKHAGPTITFLGWQTDEVIREYMRRCRALLFPGCEDFGIVPVEAQACGAPVIAFAAGGALETVEAASEGHLGTGVFFSRQTPDSLAQAMQWLERNPGCLSPAKARLHALRFDRRHFETNLVELLRQVVAEWQSTARAA